MKKLFSDLFASAVATTAAGLILLIWPSLSGRLLCYGLAFVVLLYGLYRSACYFMQETMVAMLRRDLTTGLAFIAVSVYIFAKPETIVSLLPVFFGLVLIFGALSEVQIALDMKRMADAQWFISLIVAAVLGLLGGVIFANPFSTALVLMRFIGVSLIAEGVCKFICSRLLARRKKAYFDGRGPVEADVELIEGSEE